MSDYKMKLSVIVPTYNTEQYLRRCLDSIVNQTFTPYEVVVINDGSTDSTEEILREFKESYSFFNYVNVPNGGPGKARNFALTMVTGDHVMFFDSDDFLNLYAFAKCNEMIGKYDPDMLIFDYLRYFPDEDKYTYPNHDKFLYNGLITNSEKIKKSLLSIHTMFTTRLVFRTDFLQSNNIRYGNGYYYEDFEFWTNAAVSCGRLVTLYAPLYSVQANAQSLTRTKTDSIKHAVEYINGLKAAKVYVDNQSTAVRRTFSAYAARKFTHYYNTRIPAYYKIHFLKSYLRVMGSYPVPKLESETGRLHTLRKLRGKTGSLLNRQLYRAYLHEMIRRYILKHNESPKPVTSITANRRYYENDGHVVKPVVLFTGFYYEYVGNSKYLFEQLLSSGFKYDFYFASKDVQVPDRYRVDPDSDRFYELLYTSAVVLFEGWIPGRFKRPEGKIWINLWHGTPYKRLTFDSNEHDICKKDKNHKKLSFNSLNKMSYICTDNAYVKKYFESGFMFDASRLLAFGYPRVKYLIDNKDNEQLKKELRQKFGFKDSDYIISYLPDLRDYNYKTNIDKCDFNYLLDEKAFADSIPFDFKMISKSMPCDVKTEISNIRDDIETQNLLLISNCLITDYSSVMFDALAIDIPVLIIEKDYERYELSRGLQDDIRTDLSPFTADNERELAEILFSYDTAGTAYQNLKNRYCYKPDADGNYIEFITKCIQHADVQS